MSRALRSLPFSPTDADVESEREISHRPREIPVLDDGATPTAEALTEALIFATHSLRQFGKQCIASSPLIPRLSMTRAHLLAVVAEAGNVRMGDLSRLLGVTPRNVTSLVDAVEHEGLIARRPDPTDRRAIQLGLSEKGATMMDEIHAAHQSIAERMFAPLDAAERRQFYELLRRLSGAARRTGHHVAPHHGGRDARGAAHAEENVAAKHARKEPAADKRKERRDEASGLTRPTVRGASTRAPDA
jgi:DNA-binding MarR family transcriptional regulator